MWRQRPAQLPQPRGHGARRLLLLSWQPAESRRKGAPRRRRLHLPIHCLRHFRFFRFLFLSARRHCVPQGPRDRGAVFDAPPAREVEREEEEAVGLPLSALKWIFIKTRKTM